MTHTRNNYVMIVVRAPYKVRNASRLNGIPLRVSDNNAVGLWCVLESHLALLTFNCCECAQCAASERETTKLRHKFPAGHIREKAFAFSKVWLRMLLSLFVYCLKHLIAQTALQYRNICALWLLFTACRSSAFLLADLAHDIGKNQMSK
jgi:hypothetical protein